MNLFTKLFGKKCFIIDAKFAHMECSSFRVYAKTEDAAVAKFLNEPFVSGQRLLSIKVYEVE
jgi:hypothetical protein